MPASIMKAAERKERFAREYVIDLNGQRAAIAAGYSENGANVAAARMLQNVTVRKLIDRLNAERASKLEIRGEKVLEEISRLAFSNMLDYVRVNNDGSAYVDLSGVSRDQAAAIQELVSEEYVEGHGKDARDVKRTKLKLSAKRDALELLGKHLGILGVDGGQVNVAIQVNGDLPRPVRAVTVTELGKGEEATQP